MTPHDLHYLRSILGHLREVRDAILRSDDVLTLSCVVLADNIDWLDCFIEKHERDRVLDKEVAARRVL